MNEFLQQSFKEIGIDIDFKVVELETLYTHWRKGRGRRDERRITANNIAYVTSDPLYAIVRFFHSARWRRSASTGAATRTRRSTP